MSKVNKFLNPHKATTGSPEIPAMSVNSIDELGKMDMRLIRSGYGQLYTMDKDGQCKQQDEVWFYKLLRFRHYGEVVK